MGMKTNFYKDGLKIDELDEVIKDVTTEALKVLEQQFRLLNWVKSKINSDDETDKKVGVACVTIIGGFITGEFYELLEEQLAKYNIRDQNIKKTSLI